MATQHFQSDDEYRELNLQDSIDLFLLDCREGYEGCEGECESPDDFKDSLDELLQFDDEHGTIRASLSEVNVDVNLTYLTEKYYTYTDKEKLLLRYAEKFRKRFLEQYTNRSRLILALANECNVQKFVSTTIRRSFLSYPELKTWQGCMKFVSDFLAYETDGGFKMETDRTIPKMLLDDELFSVVWFKTYNTDNKKIIEVVPNSWITQNKKKKPFCYYPPKKFWKHVPQWAQDFEDPGSTWSKFSVTLELQNCTYEKGEIFINKEIAKYAVQSAQEDSDSNESAYSDNESPHKKDLDEPIIDATKLMTTIPAYQKIAVSEKSSMKYSEQTKTNAKRKASEEPLSPTSENDSDDFSSEKISKMKQVSKRADPNKLNDKEQHRTEQQEKNLSDKNKSSSCKKFCYSSDPRAQNGIDRSKTEQIISKKKSPTRNQNKSQSDDDSFSESIDQESDAAVNYKRLKQDIEILLGKQFTSLKRSLVYDINKRHEELVCMIKIKKGQSSLLVDAREKLNFPSAFEHVEEFIEFDESLENDEKAKLTPNALKSPSYLVLHQKGNSFEYATFLVSLLLGQGYNAFVVSGYAAREVVECDTRKIPSPYQDKFDDSSQKEVKDEHPNPYTFKAPPDFKSKFLQQEEEKKTKNLSGELAKQKEEEERKDKKYELLVPDKYHGRRIHAWVLILPDPEGPKTDEIKEPLFVEATSGIAFELTNQKVEQFYVGVESIWNDLNYWINLQTPPVSCTEIEWDLENKNHWVQLLPEEHTELLLNDPSEIQDCIYEEKNLDMASSYVKEITISSADYEKRYPDETKTILYKKCRVELYSPYYHSNGLIKRITIYEDYNYKIAVNTTDEYLHRMDHLLKTYTDWKTNKIIDFYNKGRLDACKEHCYSVDSGNTILDEQSLTFYHEVRFDGLSEILTDPFTLTLTFINRDDFLKCRKVEFVERRCEIHINIKFIKKITEWFDRNPSLSASKNISVRKFDMQSNEMHLKYFYNDEDYTRASKAYKKLLVMSEDKETFVFDPKLTWSYSPEEIPSPEHILPLYYEFKELISIEQDILQAIDNSEVIIYKFLMTKNMEFENPQLSVSIFNRNRNTTERNKMLQKEQMMLEHSHRIFSGDIDYLQIYLAELGDPEKLPKEQLAQIREKCTKDCKRHVSRKINKMKAEIKDCQLKIGRLEASLKQTEEESEEQIDQINEQINNLRSHMSTRAKALTRYKNSHVQDSSNTSIPARNFFTMKF